MLCELLLFRWKLSRQDLIKRLSTSRRILKEERGEERISLSLFATLNFGQPYPPVMRTANLGLLLAPVKTKNIE